MASSNIAITKAQGWVQVTGAIISNVGSTTGQFLTNPSTPDITLDGHSLAPTEGLNYSDLPSENLYFKTESNKIVLAVSE